MEEQKRAKSKVFKVLTSQPFILFVFIILVAVVTNSINSKFLTWGTINSILGQAAGLGLVSAGATVLVISGHFDISTGRMLGLAMCAMAIMLNGGMHPVLVSVLGILICVACSVFNGAVSIAFQAPSFVVTLATQNIYYSIALLLTNGYMQTLYGKYRTLASFRIFGVFPLIYLILILGFVSIHVILKHTRTGRHVYAIGTNERAVQTNDNQTNSGMIDLFIECQESGREPEISGESVWQAMRAVFGSVESSQKGRTVTVNGEDQEGTGEA